MKLFSKPKTITLSKDKDIKVPSGAQSPVKSTIGAHVLRGGFANASTTSLVDPGSSGSSLYASANASTSTLVPASAEKEKEKDKHRHNFLSRGKHKLNEHAVLPLSSASSNSQATNPDKPQPLYSFTPDSPGAGSFAKSMSGLDLRHGGRALREKKREEKNRWSRTAFSHSKPPLFPAQHSGLYGLACARHARDDTHRTRMN